jgi:hypothetical protein
MRTEFLYVNELKKCQLEARRDGILSCPCVQKPASEIQFKRMFQYMCCFILAYNYAAAAYDIPYYLLICKRNVIIECTAFVEYCVTFCLLQY